MHTTLTPYQLFLPLPSKIKHINIKEGDKTNTTYFAVLKTYTRVAHVVHTCLVSVVRTFSSNLLINFRYLVTLPQLPSGSS